MIANLPSLFATKIYESVRADLVSHSTDTNCLVKQRQEIFLLNPRRKEETSRCVWGLGGIRWAACYPSTSCFPAMSPILPVCWGKKTLKTLHQVPHWILRHCPREFSNSSRYGTVRCSSDVHSSFFGSLILNIRPLLRGVTA